MKKLLITMAALVAMTTGALAAGNCTATHKEMVDKLSAKRNMSVYAMGIQSDGVLLEIFKSKDDKFAVILSKPGDKACMVAFGTDFLAVPMKTAGQPL